MWTILKSIILKYDEKAKKIDSLRLIYDWLFGSYLRYKFIHEFSILKKIKSTLKNEIEWFWCNNISQFWILLCIIWTSYPQIKPHLPQRRKLKRLNSSKKTTKMLKTTSTAKFKNLKYIWRLKKMKSSTI